MIELAAQSGLSESREELTREQAEAILRELAGHQADRTGREGPAARGAPPLFQSAPVAPAGAARTAAAPRAAAAGRATERVWDGPTVRAVLECVPDALILVDAGGTIVLINRQAEELFGHPRNELLGQPIELLLPERLRARHVQQRQGYVADPRVRAMGSGLDLRAVRKDGCEFPVEISLSPLRAGGELLVTATVRDVSTRREAELRLRHAEARYRTLVEEIPAVTFMAALDESASEISELYVSPQIETLLGFSQQQWLEDPVLWYTQLHPDDRDRWHVEFARTCATGEPFDAVYRFVARDGRTVWVHGHAQVVRDGDGRPLFLQGIAFDISERKQAEEALARLNEVLERRVAEAVADAERRARELARSNADLDRFAYIASHDLREPLRTMLRYIQLLDKRYEGQLDATAAGYLARTDASIRQMNQLIEDLHVHSRVGREGSLAPVDCSQVLAEVCANLRVALEESGATIAIDPLPTVHAVRTHLVILFQNLVHNAIKFRAERPPRIELHARRLDVQWWLFEVRDNGTGIEPQYFQKIFEVGERLHGRKIPGTGFGLANCQRIVERHGGTIWVESQVGRGSTFSFLLPAGDPPPGEERPPPTRPGRNR